MHVERQHHRQAEFGEQCGQRQGAAQILGVADLDQTTAGFFEQRPHRRPFIVAARRQRQHARGVEQLRLTVEAGGGTGDFDGRAGVVRNVDVGAGQAVEKDGFADVGVSDQEDGVGAG
ncbi:hypothetical protein SDC9_169250 [bioreactor metagenome]|uniref:Uncharacterized protein n=1 Tax=bioreactor metagenome TaxID=1076179 RepID=A0A645G4T0_9ZZZZ